MTRRHHPVIRDRRHALAAGVVCLVVGSWLIYDAYEGRGIQRPFAVRFLPGP